MPLQVVGRSYCVLLWFVVWVFGGVCVLGSGLPTCGWYYHVSVVLGLLMWSIVKFCGVHFR